MLRQILWQTDTPEIAPSISQLQAHAQRVLQLHLYRLLINLFTLQNSKQFAA
jgi:hypothetical protein